MSKGDPIKGSNHWSRAGKLGGETTKKRYGKDFYARIGSIGGKTTMELHSHEYEEHRRRGGESTKERYGLEHYRRIAAKSARRKQAQTRLRNEAIQNMLNDGWKIPTIIKLTWDDLPKLERYMENSLGAYLEEERPETDCQYLFVSQSGKPLSLANTYTVMKRHRSSE
ncbi:MAG: hypothetical protein ACETWB_03940 [Anaerolineae bacterium]